MKQIPSKIYLQFHGQERSELPDTDLEQYDEQSEVTWCEGYARAKGRKVKSRTVERSDIFAYISRRNEQEIMIL